MEYTERVEYTGRVAMGDMKYTRKDKVMEECTERVVINRLGQAIIVCILIQ